VVIVKHEHDIVRQAREVVEQHREHRVDRRRLRRLEHPRHILPNTRRSRLQSGDQVGKKPRRIAVALVQGEPGDPDLRFKTPAPGHPLAEYGGLAEAGRGRDKNEPASQPLIQLPGQPGTKNRVRPKWRDEELGGKDSCRHAAIIGHKCGRLGSRCAPSASGQQSLKDYVECSHDVQVVDRQLTWRHAAHHHRRKGDCKEGEGGPLTVDFAAYAPQRLLCL
jgi:hypothetical protein